MIEKDPEFQQWQVASCNTLAEAAGYIEGLLTCVRISEFYSNTQKLLGSMGTTKLCSYTWTPQLRLVSYTSEMNCKALWHRDEDSHSTPWISDAEKGSCCWKTRRPGSLIGICIVTPTLNRPWLTSSGDLEGQCPTIDKKTLPGSECLACFCIMFLGRRSLGVGAWYQRTISMNLHEGLTEWKLRSTMNLCSTAQLVLEFKK